MSLSLNRNVLKSVLLLLCTSLFSFAQENLIDSCKTYILPSDSSKSWKVATSCKDWSVFSNQLNHWINFDSFGLMIMDSSLQEAGYCDCYNCGERYRTTQIGQVFSIKICNCDSNSISVLRNIQVLPIQTQLWIKQKISSGDLIELPHISFRPNKARFLPSSIPQLEALYQLLSYDQSLNIEVNGHVNGVKSSNTKEFQTLSELRAAAVVQYLIERGIPDVRLSYKGFGNTQMIFPNAKTEAEMTQNRRVEIRVK